MRIYVFLCSMLLCFQSLAAPKFISEEPLLAPEYTIDGAALCATAKETLAYLNKGNNYDARVIHDGKVFKISLDRVKQTLIFICQNQNQLNNPAFVIRHFDFFRWYPDLKQIKRLKLNKTLITSLPKNKILMTKYYVHRAKAMTKATSIYPVAMYGLPQDEATLSLEDANKKPGLTRFHYGKQAILNGALINKNVPVLAYLKREDLEAALLQGTIMAELLDHNHQLKLFNVHRCNNIPYNKAKTPYQQERYWYFKQVDGIKGYGKDAEHKITVNSGVTFAADLEQFGLGKLLMIQYPDRTGKTVTRAGILADTGGAFENNQYQIDFLTGTYEGKKEFYKANHHLPDYVTAYFMVLKK